MQCQGCKLPLKPKEEEEDDDLLKFKPSIRMGKKGECCWCQTGWSEYFKLMIYWDFNAQPSLGFTENGQKKRKYPVSGSCVHENALLMSEENGQTG